MNKDSLNKNITFENIIKSKYEQRYDERVRVNKLSYSQEEQTDTRRNNIPTAIINDVYIWPNMRKTLRIQDMDLKETLNLAASNDRYLVIAPNNDFEHEVASLVEITLLEIRENINYIVLEVKGLKRFKVKEFRRIESEETDFIMFVSNGEIIKDLEIESNDLKSMVYQKLRYCDRVHREILDKAPSTISRKLEKLYGPIPQIPTGEMGSANLEIISLYYLNCVRSHNENISKKPLYAKTNILERLNW
jgi:ATP-dependent Lon protease